MVDVTKEREEEVFLVRPAILAPHHNQKETKPLHSPTRQQRVRRKLSALPLPLLCSRAEGEEEDQRRVPPGDGVRLVAQLAVVVLGLSTTMLMISRGMHQRAETRVVTQVPFRRLSLRESSRAMRR